MSVHGLATFAWDAGDEAGRRLAAVQLVRLRAVSQAQAAAAFGVDPVTVWRWDQALAAGGVAGLVPARRGPKGASKLTPELAARIRELDAAGATLSEIAAATGVSTFSVRNALGRVAARGRPRRPGSPPAARAWTPGTMTRARALWFRCCRTRCPVMASGRWPGGGCWARAPSRCSPRARGIRWPGCCWRCRRWRAPACWPPREVYGRVKDGFYGLGATLLTLVFLALAGEPRAEGATRVPPGALGRVLGLDRAPEVKTIRRKLAELAAAGQGRGPGHGAGPPARRGPAGRAGVLLRRRARPRLLRDPDRAEDPRGAAEVPRPGHDGDLGHRSDGDPVFMVVAEPSDSLAGELRRLLPQLRGIAGQGRRVTVCFDRGGWSPALFADITAAGFGLFTWRKGPAPDLPAGVFRTVVCTDDRGRARESTWPTPW